MVDRRLHDDLRKIYLHLKAPRFDLHRTQSDGLTRAMDRAARLLPRIQRETRARVFAFNAHSTRDADAGALPRIQRETLAPRPIRVVPSGGALYTAAASVRFAKSE
jgi:hypothetical protein